ncbi:unnamed protein product, partial [Protopolystoma xenopodis]
MHWHLSRKTGEMLRIMDRGTSSVSSVLNYLIFNILPTLIDILIGVIFFLTAFNIWYALLSCSLLNFLSPDPKVPLRSLGLHAFFISPALGKGQSSDQHMDASLEVKD